MSSEIAAEIGQARLRLSKMREAVESFDRRLGALEREREVAEPRDKPGIGLQIAALSGERAAALELLAEAERQLGDRQEAYRESAEATRKNLGQIGSAVDEAARRFDRALREAAAALDELERAAEPLAGAGLLAGGLKSYFHMRHADEAFRQAFEHRLGAGGLHLSRRSMVDWVAMMMADARANLAAARKKEAA